MNNLEKIELNCRKLIAAKTSSEPSDILIDSIGYMGLAQAYVQLCDKYLAERVKNCKDLTGE